MKLWHYRLIPYLPEQVLGELWKTTHLISLRSRSEVKLINKIDTYDKWHFKTYCDMMYVEAAKRNIQLSILDYTPDKVFNVPPFSDWHNDEYLDICYYAMLEKYSWNEISQKEWNVFKQGYETIKSEKKIVVSFRLDTPSYPDILSIEEDTEEHYFNNYELAEIGVDLHTYYHQSKGVYYIICNNKEELYDVLFWLGGGVSV